MSSEAEDPERSEPESDARTRKSEPVEETVVEAEAVTDALTAQDLGIDLPDDPQAAVDLLVGEVSVARDEAAAYLDDLRRVAADFENFRKRALRDQQETTQRAAERILVELLPALDSFDAAVAVEPSSESEEKLMAGMHRTHSQLIALLEKQGLEVVETIGAPFDPEVHEAVMSPSDGTGNLVVSQELRRGYALKGRLVRPALVALDFEQGE